jgi:hypothetical protein
MQDGAAGLRRNNMAIVNIGELLDRAAAFEGKLEECFISIRDNTENDGVRLLTYYLSKNRRHLSRAIEDIDDAELQHVRKVQLKFGVDFNADKAFHIIDLDPKSITGDQLLDAAIAYDAELIELYKGILTQPLIDEAKVFVESLVRVEERDIVMLKKTRAMSYF